MNDLNNHKLEICVKDPYYQVPHSGLGKYIYFICKKIGTHVWALKTQMESNVHPILMHSDFLVKLSIFGLEKVLKTENIHSGTLIIILTES